MYGRRRGEGDQGHHVVLNGSARQSRQFLLALGKHGHAITPLGCCVKLAAVVDGDDGALALGAVFAFAIGEVGHVVPF